GPTGNKRLERCHGADLQRLLPAIRGPSPEKSRDAERLLLANWGPHLVPADSDFTEDRQVDVPKIHVGVEEPQRMDFGNALRALVEQVVDGGHLKLVHYPAELLITAGRSCSRYSFRQSRKNVWWAFSSIAR